MFGELPYFSLYTAINRLSSLGVNEYVYTRIHVFDFEWIDVSRVVAWGYAEI